jgi:cytochrome c556
MKRHLIAAGFLMLGIGTVLAQGDVIAERQQTMKDTSKVTGEAVKVLKGEQPFDLAAVQGWLNVYIATAKKMPTLFPDNSKTGGNTHALPAIWENKPEFEGIFAKLGKDASDGLANIKDEASFKATFPGILKNCGTCHETYRAPLN